MTAATTTAEPGQMQGSLSARCALAAANALMAAVLGTLTLGAGVGIIAALVAAILPFTPYLRHVGRAIVAWAKETPLGACLGVFLLCWILGSIIWGLSFAFGIALVLAPVSLMAIVVITLSLDSSY